MKARDHQTPRGAPYRQLAASRLVLCLLMAMRGRGRAGSSRPSPYGGGGYGGGYGGGGDDDGCAVYVGNLPYDVTWKELKDHM